MSTPKLIILSGPLGVGKSTIAAMYVDNHPLALNLDIDDVRLHLGQWREHPEESARQSKHMAEEMARINLMAGYDVIIPQIYRHEEYLFRLEKVAVDTKARLFEVVLHVDKEEAVKRFMDKNGRGGFSPGGLIDKGGGIKKLESMHDEMSELIAKRPAAIKLEPIFGDIEGTYKKLLDILEA